MSDKSSRLIKINLCILCIMGLLYGLLVLVESMSNILILLGASLIVAYLLLGPVHVMDNSLQRYFPRLFANAHNDQRRHLLAIVLVLAFFVGSIGIITLNIFPTLSHQVQGFAADAPAYMQRIERKIERFSITTPEDNFISGLLKRLVSDKPLTETPERNAATDLLAEIEAEDPGATLGRVGYILQQAGSDLASYLLNIGAKTLTGLVYALTGLMLVFYLLMDGQKLKQGLVSLLPATMTRGMEAFLLHFHHVFYHFIKGQVVLSVTGGLYLYAVYSLLGVKYAFLLSFIFGLASILPVIGPWFGLTPGIVVILFSHNPVEVVYLFAFIGIYHLVKVYWLIPKLIQPALVIHPVIYILTFLICIKSASLLAILMSFPLAALIGVMVLFLKDENLNLVDPQAEPTA